ncbi:MAG: bifunctional 4-hydroxy-2-oxoglutarate aldolase/2-dehydro-3-deoxy-phosphogluconate aldolase [Spirochaetales bacterium]|nr:bifunctional 4-hydroxy-2-oxoglutarate aldolase/2-dehydro-3-deoxy-phosphogluconate aldolase [Spirochaetales bacterium]
MSSQEHIITALQRYRLVPVITIDNPAKAVPLCQALIRGGLPVAEITFRTAAAEQAIAAASKEFPDMLIGAGTVITTDQVERAKAAGAAFLVSPGFNPRIVRHAQNVNIPMFPGVNNPSDIEGALELGLDVLKFFPAEASGGLALLTAMSTPYPGVRFMPTGGINQENAGRYLADPRVVACGGSWMVPSKLIADGEFDRIEALVREAVSRTAE